MVLARTTSSFGGLLLALLAMAVYVFIFVLIIITLMRVSRYFKNAGREQKLIRMEMSKLAEEIHLLRREVKGDKVDDLSI